MATQHPLDQIRQQEAAGARSIAGAHQAAVELAKQATVQAAEIVRQAGEIGHAEGQIKAHKAIAEAEEQARALVAQAHLEADILQKRGQERMQDAASMAVSIVLGQDTEGDEP